jgi:hypothetical protein
MCAAETEETANNYGNIFTIPTRLIGEISRILRPGGAVFIDVPNEDGLYFKVGNLYNRLRGRDLVVNADPTFSPYHVFGFSSVFEKHYYRNTGSSRSYGEPIPVARWVPSRSGPVGMIEGLAAHAVTVVSKLNDWVPTLRPGRSNRNLTPLTLPIIVNVFALGEFL